MRKIMLLCLSLIMIVALTASGQSPMQFDFADVEGNPVLPVGDVGSMNNGGIQGHTVVEHEGLYYAFFSGISNNGPSGLGAVGLMISEDAIHFEPSAANPIISPDETFNHVGFLTAMVDEGRFVLMFADATDAHLAGSKVFLATADDPEGPWEVQQVLDFGERSWDRRIDPGGLVRVDGEYRLYYTGMNSRWTNSQMGLATSPDLVNWTLRDEPVLDIGGDDEWDFMGVDAANPVPTADGWELFYVGFDIPPTTNWYSGNPEHELYLGYATSPDGIEWTKYEGNPVINTHLHAAPSLSMFKLDEMYHIYYNYRRNALGTGIGLMTGTVAK
ncbi:MAG: hypothetical protein L0154_04255 [Chloroflexi bacterium]|nr:hypothetical protein [Chloroflexota bacterium]